MSEKRAPTWLRWYSVAAYLYIYIPIITLMVFSFNTMKLNIRWQGFTLDWYKVLFNDQQVALAAQNTLIIAISSTIVATIVAFRLMSECWERRRRICETGCRIQLSESDPSRRLMGSWRPLPSAESP